MKKKEEISNKNKKIWEEYINNPAGLYDKDKGKKESSEKNYRYRYDLHGFSLAEANFKVKEIINKCYEKRFKQILLITGKGLHSTSSQDVYASEKLSKLKFAVPEYINTQKELKEKIVSIEDAKKKDGGEGALIITLKSL